MTTTTTTRATTRSGRAERLARHTGPAATDNELRTRAWTAVARARKPLTAVVLADRAGITRGAALAWLREWTAEGHLTCHPIPGCPAPYLTAYTRTNQPRSVMPTPAAPTTAADSPAAVTDQESSTSAMARGAVGPVRRDALIPAALAYAARGWHVFPLVPGAKRPAVANWEQRATTDLARIRRCWSHAAYGIGIACGPSGLVVIDLDTPKRNAYPYDGRPVEPPEPWRLPGVHDGLDVFTVLAARHGEDGTPDTYTVTTGRSGAHLYFTAPTGEGEPLRNTTGSLGWLIDTRGAGGYVVAPPTVVDGRPYGVANDSPPAPLPLWLTDALRPAPLPAQEPVTVALTAPTGRRGGDDRTAEDQRREAYLRAAVDRTLATIAAAESGGRNRALYGAAVSLGQLVAGGELDPDTTAAALQAAGVAVGQGTREAAATVRSGMRAGANRPRRITTADSTDRRQEAAA